MFPHLFDRTTNNNKGRGNTNVVVGAKPGAAVRTNTSNQNDGDENLNLVYGTGQFPDGQPFTQQTFTFTSSYGSSNRSPPQGQGHNPHGNNQSYAQGYGPYYPQGQNQSYPQGQNQSYLQGHNQSYSQGSNTYHPQGYDHYHLHGQYKQANQFAGPPTPFLLGWHGIQNNQQPDEASELGCASPKELPSTPNSPGRQSPTSKPTSIAKKRTDAYR